MITIRSYIARAAGLFGPSNYSQENGQIGLATVQFGGCPLVSSVLLKDAELTSLRLSLSMVLHKHFCLLGTA